MPFAAVVAAAWLGASPAAAEPIPAPATLAGRQFNTLTYEGCYSSSSGLSFNSSYTFNSKGYCQKECVPAGFSVQATTNKTDCWCGNDLPPPSSRVDDSFCNAGCGGIDTEMCKLARDETCDESDVNHRWLGRGEILVGLPHGLWSRGQSSGRVEFVAVSRDVHGNPHDIGPTVGHHPQRQVLSSILGGSGG